MKEWNSLHFLWFDGSLTCHSLPLLPSSWVSFINVKTRGSLRESNKSSWALTKWLSISDFCCDSIENVGSCTGGGTMVSSGEMSEKIYSSWKNWILKVLKILTPSWSLFSFFLVLQAVKLRPNDARAHTNLGAILHLLGQTQQATLSYKNALNLQPDDPTTLGNLKKLGVTVKSWRWCRWRRISVT